MSIITDLTRMWLTRSVKPFTFRSEYDQALPFAQCQDLGLYVHIPFCKQLCAFCPYCKEPYAPDRCARYLDALLQEIHLVGSQSPGKKRATSLYFGGGTPALAADRLAGLIAALEEHFTITQGVGVELHPDNVTVPILQTLKRAGVTKLSIGVQSFQPEHQRTLGRPSPDRSAMAEALSQVPFETVSMDFIFALPGQTLDHLRADLAAAFQCGANHVAIYPFIDFSFTSSAPVPMGSREKRALLDGITRWCLAQGCTRTSIWTFSRGGAGYSSMTRDNFLGFGCSAATLLRDQFKINTFSVDEYCKRTGGGALPTALTLRFTPRQRMVYYLFWTAYSTKVDAEAFRRFFGVPLQAVYGHELRLAQRLGLVTEKNGVYEMTLKGAFYYHYYEGFYTLSYIDKMWGLLRTQPFPEGMEL